MPSQTFCLADRFFLFSSGKDLPFPESYSPFQVTDRSENLDGAYTFRDSLNSLPSKSVLWTGPTWRMVCEEESYRVDLRILDTEEWMPSARVCSDFSRGELVPLVGRDPAPSSAALNYPLDQVLFINRLPRCGAVLLHASGVLHHEKIYLFCGRSDIGKTTLARLWRDAGATLLNDDRMLIWMDGDTLLASPSPWHGEDPEIHVHKAPVTGIYHLHQSREHTLESLPPVQALSALTATAVLPFYLKENLEYGLTVLHAAAGQAASYRLGFQPAPDVVEFVMRGI